MNTTGFCVAYREAGSEEWRFVRDVLYYGEITVAVLQSHKEALNLLAKQGFDVTTETTIVPVTISGELPK